MSGWDLGGISYSDQTNVDNGSRTSAFENTIEAISKKFISFIRLFTSDENVFFYRDQLQFHINLHKYWLEVNFEDIQSFDENLASGIIDQPATYLPIFEDVVGQLAYTLNKNRESSPSEGGESSPSPQTLPQIQIRLRSVQESIPIRNLYSDSISKLVNVYGIVVSASQIHAKPTHIAIQCRNCLDTKLISVKFGLGDFSLPSSCDSGKINPRTGDHCPNDPFVIQPDGCLFVDSQILKLQESPETIPTGEMPRTVILSVDRSLVGLAVPGSRVSVTGIYTTMNTLGGIRSGSKQGNRLIRVPYLRVIGISLEHSRATGAHAAIFKPDEEAQFINLSKQPKLLDILTDSVAPAIYGHADIKRAMLCQLFGGSSKHLPDGLKLRGDINVLLLGDPGTAKSQMLKFVEKVAPIGVYTSGKGSSAAGLTASVIRDPSTKEFYLEGGAMVLADGGIVCIDEFDKMDTSDRVAIHEAMEQQTISIAKAGITTILNSRTAVLAAANPVFGRYDELRSASENIDFQSTILSRFDMIFILRDKRDERKDRRIAEHVMQMHIDELTRQRANIVTVPLPFLKRYITYCRTKSAPRVSKTSATILQDYFVNIRATARAREAEGKDNVIPISVRQLEAIIRTSEALAKMELSPITTENHVEEALRLFSVSTMEAMNASSVVTTENLNPAAMAEVQNVENMLRRAIPIGYSLSEKRIQDTFIKQGSPFYSIRMAIDIMIKRNELEYRRQRKHLYRIR